MPLSRDMPRANLKQTSFLSHVKRALSIRWRRWIDQRQPAESSVELNQRNLYILPTRQGLGFILLLILLWLMGTNYENNLVLILAFFLLAVFLTTLLATHQNLKGLKLSVFDAPSVFAGQPLRLGILVENPRRQTAYSLMIRRITQPDSVEQAPVLLDIPSGQVGTYHLELPTEKRGWLIPERVCIESTYPLGLFRVWSFPQFHYRVVIYPKPVEQSLNAQAEAGTLGFTQTRGDDDLAGVEPWREGTGMQRIAWKQMAADRGMFEKRFEQSATDPRWLSWEDYQTHPELRLSALCARAIEHSRRNHPFGLRLPGIRIEPSQGAVHLHAVLVQLALFELA